MRVRATLKLRNDAMLSARERLGLTQVQAAEFAGVPVATYKNFERFRFIGSPHRLFRAADLIALALDLEPEVVMPPNAVGTRAETTHVRTFDADILNLGSGDGTGDYTQLASLPASTQAEEAEDRESIIGKVRAHIGDLTYREQEILKLRFGLEGEQPYTMEDVAKIFKVTRERVRQIEARALRRIKGKIQNEVAGGGL